jgi:hypothetical protein
MQVNRFIGFASQFHISTVLCMLSVPGAIHRGTTLKLLTQTDKMGSVYQTKAVQHSVAVRGTSASVGTSP